jgi:hypothetical protein
LAAASRSSWRKARQFDGDLKRWHRATERLRSIRGEAAPGDQADVATLWCKVVETNEIRLADGPLLERPAPSGVGAGERSYDHGREPTSNS